MRPSLLPGLEQAGCCLVGPAAGSVVDVPGCFVSVAALEEASVAWSAALAGGIAEEAATVTAAAAAWLPDVSLLKNKQCYMRGDN